MYYKEQLDHLVEQGCEKTGCDCHQRPILLTSECHGGPALTEYFNGKITVRCGVCFKQALSISVARINDYQKRKILG